MPERTQEDRLTQKQVDQLGDYTQAIGEALDVVKKYVKEHPDMSYARWRKRLERRMKKLNV